jgi:anti-anti-sigma regulatory factor
MNMDIRARLLIAFSPLLVLLIGTAIALPIIKRESNTLLANQLAAVDNLSSLQAFEVYVVREHSAIIHLIEAEEAGEASELFVASRAGAEAILAERERAGWVAPQEAQLRTLYSELKLLHDQVMNLFELDQLGEADDLLDGERADELVDTILALSAGDRTALREELASTTQALGASQNEALLRTALTTLIGIVLALLLAWLLVESVVRPLNRLTADAERLASGDQDGALSPVGRISQIQRLRDAFQQLLDVNRRREQQLTTTLGEIEERIAHEAQLRATVEALSVPTVPLGEGMLLLPLMGHLDAQRLASITHELLERIQQERAKALVIDFTGLPELSTGVVAELGQLVEAARLLGCRVTLVGIRAEHAASLAAGDLARSGVAIARDIPAVLSTIGSAQNVVQSPAL